MPIKTYRTLSLEELLQRLEAEEIQVLMIPAEKDDFYSVTIKETNFFVTKGSCNRVFSNLQLDIYDILERWGHLRVFHAIVASTGAAASILMKRYENKCGRP